MPIPLSEGIYYIRVFQGLYGVLQGLTVRIRNSVHVMPQAYSMRELPNAPSEAPVIDIQTCRTYFARQGDGLILKVARKMRR